MDPRVAKTLEIMRRDFHRDFRLAELAAAVHLSPSRLAHLFRAEVGLPPRRYLSRMRLGEAWAFLDELLFDLRENEFPLPLATASSRADERRPGERRLTERRARAGNGSKGRRASPPAERRKAVVQLIHEHRVGFTGPDRTSYSVRTFGRQRQDGTWIGWIEFHPVGESGRILRTGRETTQPNRKALAYWADGLEPLYFEGAFERAH